MLKISAPSACNATVRALALPWTRVIAGPLRGLRFRSAANGAVLVTIRSDGEKAAADAKLLAKGYLVFDAPPGCEYQDAKEPKS